MQKRKSAFNVIDALIIILLAMAAAGAYFLFFGSGGMGFDNGSGKAERIRYVLQINELPIEYSDNIKEGETVIDGGTTTAAGTVVAVDFKNSVYVGYDKATGEQKLTTLDEYVDLYITVEGDAKVKDNIFYVNDTSMYVGKSLDMMMPDLYCSGSCISLVTVE